MILFCHGLEGGPVGRKSLALQAAGFPLVAPDCRGLDLAARVATITAAIDDLAPPPVVVGSSFGGLAGLLAVIAAVAGGRRIPALMLLAPALHLPLPPALTCPLGPPVPTVIIHGTEDAVVPIAVSREFAGAHPAIRLIEVADDHRLAASLGTIVAALEGIPEARGGLETSI